MEIAQPRLAYSLLCQIVGVEMLQRKLTDGFYMWNPYKMICQNSDW